MSPISIFGLTVAAGALALGIRHLWREATNPKTYYRCIRPGCGLNEIQARDIRCGRSPCPMAFTCAPYATGGIIRVEADSIPAVLPPSEHYIPHSYRERLGPSLRELVEEHPGEMVPYVHSMKIDVPTTLAQKALNDLVAETLSKARVYPKVPR